jgi:hypothetical protein
LQDTRLTKLKGDRQFNEQSETESFFSVIAAHPHCVGSGGFSFEKPKGFSGVLFRRWRLRTLAFFLA